LLPSIQRFKNERKRIAQSLIVRNAGWMFAGQGLSVLCQATYFILLARLLGSTEYGRYVGALSMATILSQYSALGSREVFIRYVGGDPEKFSLYWGNILVTTFGLGTLFVGMMTFVAPRFASTYSWKMLLCVAVGDCLCAQLTAGAGRVFQAFERMYVTAGLSVLINLLRALVAGFMLWHLHSGTAQQWAVASLIVASLAAIVAVASVTRAFGKPAFSPALLRQRTGEGFVFALSYSTDGVYNNVDKALLGHYGMNAANGVYTMAYRLIDVSTAPITSIHSSAFPTFFRRGVDGVSSTARYALQILKRTAPLALLSSMGLLLLAPILPHFLGKGFTESVSVLRWLCVLPIFRSFQLSAGDALTGAGHQRIRLGIQASAAALNLGVNLYLIPRYSWQGAAWSSLATDGLLAVCNWAAIASLIAKKRQQRELVEYT
jgi:O-antigen/teichoic acid export membrane protein